MTLFITLRAESPSIFLDKSGRGRRLCEGLQDFLLSMLQRKGNRASINLVVKICRRPQGSHTKSS